MSDSYQAGGRIDPARLLAAAAQLRRPVTILELRELDSVAPAGPGRQSTTLHRSRADDEDTR